MHLSIYSVVWFLFVNVDKHAHWKCSGSNVKERTVVQILLLQFQKLSNFVHLHYLSSLVCIIEYLAIDSGGYM